MVECLLVIWLELSMVHVSELLTVHDDDDTTQYDTIDDVAMMTTRWCDDDNAMIDDGATMTIQYDMIDDGATMRW